MAELIPLRDLPLNRRRLIGCAALFGVAGPILVACGSDSDADDSTADAGSTDSPSPSPGPGEVLVATADVPVGGGVILPNLNVAVTQPTKGEFLGFDSRCTHQGATLGAPKDGILTCPLHGSQFSVEGDNLVGPNGGDAGTTGDLVEVAVTVEGDNVVRA